VSWRYVTAIIETYPGGRRSSVADSSTDATEKYRPARGGGVFIASALIGAGVVLLLNNLGILDWGVWRVILLLWPVLVIAAGISIVFGQRSIVGAAVTATLILGTIGGAVWLYANDYVARQTTPVTRETVSQSFGNATMADVDITVGAANLNINALPNESSNLLEGSVASFRGETVSRDFSIRGSTARLTLYTTPHSDVWWNPTDLLSEEGWRDRAWNLSINGSLPTSLRIETGVGDSEINLAQTRVSDLTLKTGLGNTALTLPNSGKVTVKIERGVGSVSIRIPSNVAARVRSEEGLGRLRVSGDLQKSGDWYVTPDWSTAESRVEIRVSGGIGDTTIVQEQGE
jgi:hypothetical protein